MILSDRRCDRSSFYYKPKLETQKAGRVFSKTTQKTTGGYDDNELVIEHIKTLLAEPFIDYGYLKGTFFLRDEKNYIINPKNRNACRVYGLMQADSLKWNIRQRDVIILVDKIFENYELSDSFYVRNDNGSQFIADLVQQYFQNKNVIQTFTGRHSAKPATPEQNARGRPAILNHIIISWKV